MAYVSTFDLERRPAVQRASWPAAVRSSQTQQSNQALDQAH